MSDAINKDTLKLNRFHILRHFAVVPTQYKDFEDQLEKGALDETGVDIEVPEKQQPGGPSQRMGLPLFDLFIVIESHIDQVRSISLSIQPGKRNFDYFFGEQIV